MSALSPSCAPGSDPSALGPGDQLLVTSAFVVINADSADAALLCVRQSVARHAALFDPRFCAPLTQRLVEWSAYREEIAQLRASLGAQEKARGPGSYGVEARKVEHPKPYYRNGDSVAYSIASVEPGPVTTAPHFWACDSLGSEIALRESLAALKERQDIERELPSHPSLPRPPRAAL